MPRFHRLFCGALAFVFAAQLARSVFAQPAGDVDFNRDIRPILSENCFQCHGPDAGARQAGLRLDLAAEATAVLESGERAISPGAIEGSALVARIKADDPAARMPPEETGKKLTPRQIDLLERWIAAGAEYQSHWSWMAPRKSALPAVAKHEWPRSPLDAFSLARLEANGLEPSPEAARETLLRRVTLDLTGLPPTPAEIRAFLDDASPDAYERVVDRLLASPHYGERMAVDWLDAARYADTNGYNNDEPRVMWPWRDWVIAAFNKNMPFDQFATEQLAGDLLPQPSIEQQVATGFNRNHVLTTEGGIIDEEYRVEYVADRVHTTATVFLGMSMQCARCHDHKFDAISQRDYYQFFAFFNQIADTIQGYSRTEPLPPIVKSPTHLQSPEVARLQGERQRLNQAIVDRLREAPTLARAWEDGLAPSDREKLAAAGIVAAALSGSGEAMGAARLLRKPRADRSAEENEKLAKFFSAAFDSTMRDRKAELASIDAEAAKLDTAVPTVMVMQEIAQPRQTRMLARGQYDQPGEPVTAGVPANLPPMPEGAPLNRLGLAQWLIDPANPLTARVAVNRWWRLYFGEGLVETVEDFGSQGAVPSDPELLDWLAIELVRSGWNIKALQRAIVTSATYRQSSHASPELLERDPANRLLSRGPRFRLPAESIRDSALAASGLLVETVGGPSVMPYQPAGLWEDVSVERKYVYTPDPGAGLYRRSMYTFWKRTCPPPAMTALDAPDRESCVARRARTNTPLQALILLNDPTYVEAARRLAEQMLAGASDSDRLAIGAARALGRTLRDDEREILLSIHGSAVAKFAADAPSARALLGVGRSGAAAQSGDDQQACDLAAWTVVASTLLNLDEAITKH